jgi:hypothetical protein
LIDLYIKYIRPKLLEKRVERRAKKLLDDGSQLFLNKNGMSFAGSGVTHRFLKHWRLGSEGNKSLVIRLPPHKLRISNAVAEAQKKNPELAECVSDKIYA